MDIQPSSSSLNPRAATQRSRPPSIHASVENELASLEPRKRSRPPSPSASSGGNNGNKRLKLTDGLWKLGTSFLQAATAPFSSPAHNSPPRSIADSPKPPSIPLTVDPSSPPPLGVGTGASSALISSATALEIDYCPAHPAQREVDIHRSPILAKCNFFVLEKERVVVCELCRHGYLLKRAYTHRRDVHKAKLSIADQRSLDAELRKAGVAEHPDELRVRPFGEAPIPEIDHTDGIACDVHAVAWMRGQAATAHEREMGCKTRECQIQSILEPQYRAGMCWVRVDPSADTASDGASDGDENCYSAFHRTWAVKLREKPLVIAGPVDDNGVTLLEKSTGWLQHLKGYIGSRGEVEGVMSLTKPDDARPEIQLAKEVINIYIDEGISIAENADFHARVLLMGCPR